ncbi:MAG: alpha/beta fold hydrolase [Actinomycetes bacterium]|jgi:pimeloyl-ACP methyl ester carboxylesterase|nr:alpha/beta hydrolase [Actinomycetes bacterium]
MTTRHEIPVPGSTLAADETGNGTPVVLLHAGVGDARMWDPVVERLEDRYRLIRYDVRGYGRSPAPTAPFSKLADLVAVLDYFGLDRAHLVGCSMGGQLAMDCAIAYPDRVRTLTLLAPGLSGYDWPDDPDDERIMQAVTDQNLDYIADFVLKIWAQGQGTDPQTDAIVVEQAKDSAKAWLTEDFEEREPSAVDRLGEISQPTVLLVGDRDYPVIEDVAALVVARIPGARRVDAPGVDHFVPLRVPDLVSELVAEQVERASQRPDAS